MLNMYDSRRYHEERTIMDQIGSFQLQVTEYLLNVKNLRTCIFLGKKVSQQGSSRVDTS